MSRWLRTTRAKLMAAIALILALIAALPLSLAFRTFGLDDMGVAARALRGPFWWGGAEELTMGGIRLGTVRVSVSPLRLLVGQVHIFIARQSGGQDDIAGSVIISPGSRRLDGITGLVPIADALAPLPVSRVEFDHFSVRFAGGVCADTDGRVRVRVLAFVPGLDLANGLAGAARCDGQDLLLPLVSQSGQEKFDLRVRADGHFEATMRIKAADPALAGALAANGFRPAGGEQRLKVVGRL